MQDDAGCRCQEGPQGAQDVGKSLTPPWKMFHPPLPPPEPGSFILPTSLGPLEQLPGEAGPRPVGPEKNNNSDYNPNGYQAKS